MEVVIILDVNDLLGSYPAAAIDYINEKDLNCTLVINKMDSVPSNINEQTLKQSIKKYVAKMKPQINN